jgi:hypothetical protein
MVSGMNMMAWVCQAVAVNDAVGNAVGDAADDVFRDAMFEASDFKHHFEWFSVIKNSTN